MKSVIAVLATNKEEFDKFNKSVKGIDSTFVFYDNCNVLFGVRLSGVVIVGTFLEAVTNAKEIYYEVKMRVV